MCYMLSYFIARCDYEGGQYNTSIPIPVNVTTFKYNVTILDDDIYEITEKLTIVIDRSWHNQIRIVNPNTAVVTIQDDEERK